jgi:thiosulfate/3-mercaptopyruvate sulfurtransferase
MTLKTLGLAPVLLLLGLLLGAPALVAQPSPLQWPVPAPGPRREVRFPHLLIGAAELARALRPRSPAGAASPPSTPTIPMIPIDARGAGPFTAGHLPGAVPAWSAVADDATDAGSLDRLRSRLAALGISGPETVVIYGDADREAVAHLYRLLRWAGCAEVRILDGGMDAWRSAGQSVETGESRRPAAAGFRAVQPGSPDETAVGAAWVADHFGLAGVELLDVRDARGWERWETPPTFAAGHIPSSLPFDPRALLPAGGGWPEPAGLRRRLGTLGPRAGDPVRLDSTFVLSGEAPRDPRPDLGLLLLAMAGLEARVFPGGWQDWTAGGARPIVRVVPAAEVAALLRRESPELATDRRPRGLILIDLREPRDFAIGHLPGALNLPILRFPADFEPLVAADWPQADRATFPLLLYCYGVDCVRSRQAGAEAARRGFRNVLWFRGGVEEWRDAAYPLFESPFLDSPLLGAPPATASEPASPGCAGARP